MSHLLEAALALAEAGYAVFPLKPKDKVPAVAKGCLEATTDLAQVTAWWMKNPNCNIGIALGGINKIIAIDVDFKDGCRADFMDSIPPTVLTITPTGGRHVFFKMPEEGIKNGKRLEKGATVRATGYYVVAAPSIHPETKTAYTWGKEQKGSLVDGEIADCPEWIKTGPEWSEKKAGKEVVTVGSRHEALKTKATALRFKGHESEFIRGELLKFNETFEAPKEEKEIDQIVGWAMQHIEPQIDLSEPETGEYVNTLGHLDGTYYYTSSSNKQLVIIPRSQHNRLVLLDLMPESYWIKKFPKKDESDAVIGANYGLAAAKLMERGRLVGGFSSGRIKGTGAWLEGDKALINLGEHLEVDGQKVDFGAVKSRNVYIESMPLRPLNPEPLDNHGAKILVDAVEALNWEHRESAKYLLGWCAIARLCGALEWRPHCWLTGPSGSGKSTVIEMIVKNICGDMAIQPVGNSSEPGIRQAAKFNALPIIFDEAESNNRASAKRIQGVLELARQASSASDARIMKGTANQSGIQFKINCVFILSSIQVSLMEEADQNRFTVLELQRNDGAKWTEVKKKLDLVTEELGDRLFSRMIRLFPVLKKNIEVFRNVIAEVHGQRIGLHYGTLLAGYWCLDHEGVVTVETAKEMVSGMRLAGRESIQVEKDDTECLQHLETSVVPVVVGDSMSRMKVFELIQESYGDGKLSPENSFNKQLQRFGMKVEGKDFYISNRDTELARLFTGTKWEGNGAWVRTLRRIPGAEAGRARFGGKQIRVTRIPLAVLIKDASEA